MFTCCGWDCDGMSTDGLKLMMRLNCCCWREALRWKHWLSLAERLKLTHSLLTTGLLTGFMTRSLVWCCVVIRGGGRLQLMKRGKLAALWHASSFQKKTRSLGKITTSNDQYNQDRQWEYAMSNVCQANIKSHKWWNDNFNQVNNDSLCAGCVAFYQAFFKNGERSNLLSEKSSRPIVQIIVLALNYFSI